MLLDPPLARDLTLPHAMKWYLQAFIGFGDHLEMYVFALDGLKK
jgi:hypothetical protein